MITGSFGNLLRIGVFYDGQYFYHVSNYYAYEHERKARISISGLHKYIKKEASVMTGRDELRCQIVDAHYFRGRHTAQKSEEGNKLYNERVFDDVLMKENVVTHYLTLNYDKKTDRPIEKGIDVWLALEAYEMAVYKRFDVLVLIACDGDYVPLVRKVNTVGSQVMLLSWDFKSYDKFNYERETKTAQALIEGVSHYVPMHKRIDENGLLINDLFVPRTEKESRQIPTLTTNENDVEDANEEIRESTILNIPENKGYGFISDKTVNNIFFHYTSLENIDFNDLRVGMKVKYVQSRKKDGTYIADKVWIA